MGTPCSLNDGSVGLLPGNSPASSYQRRVWRAPARDDEGPNTAFDFDGFLRSAEEAIYIPLRQREPATAVRAMARDKRGEQQGRTWPRRGSQYVVALGGPGRGAVVGGPCGYRRTVARPTVRAPWRGPRHHAWGPPAATSSSQRRARRCRALGRFRTSPLLARSRSCLSHSRITIE
jgi:hypothetical protein